MADERTRITLVSSSPSAQSRSRALLQHAGSILAGFDATVTTIDLRALDPLTYPQSQSDTAMVTALTHFNSADAWVLASPVYNFGATGALLNFLHYALDSDFGKWKPFVLLASLGGTRSAMSLDHLARTLVLEVNAIQVGPPINAYAETDMNKSTGKASAELDTRMREQLAVLMAMAQARRAHVERSAKVDRYSA
jgi:FMN reductase